MEQHVWAQFEGVGLPVGRHAPGLRQVAQDLRVIGRVELQQGRIVRRHGMQEREGGVAVAVVIAGLDRHRKFESAAAFGARLRTGNGTACDYCCGNRYHSAPQAPPDTAMRQDLNYSPPTQHPGLSSLPGLPGAELLEQLVFLLGCHRHLARRLPALVDKPRKHRPQLVRLQTLHQLYIAL